jgi:hypothetical protein
LIASSRGQEAGTPVADRVCPAPGGADRCGGLPGTLVPRCPRRARGHPRAAPAAVSPAAAQPGPARPAGESRDRRFRPASPRSGEDLTQRCSRNPLLSQGRVGDQRPRRMPPVLLLPGYQAMRAAPVRVRACGPVCARRHGRHGRERPTRTPGPRASSGTPGAAVPAESRPRPGRHVPPRTRGSPG